MEAVAIVTVVALAQFVFFSIQVGSMRGKHGVIAPATTGHPEFERMFRIQQNTMEQLVVLVPALWIFAWLVNPLWAAGFGVVYIIGRFIYWSSYRRDPAARGAGFTISFLPSVVMLVWSLIDASLSYL